MELPNKKWKPIEASPCRVDIVGEASGVLAVDKPVGMDTIQLSAWKTGLPRLMDVVYKEYPQARFLNRIDRNTSGLVLFGLSKDARMKLSEAWFGSGDASQRRKVYLAVITGVPAWKFNENHTPLRNQTTKKVEVASTTFEVLGSDYKANWSLLKCELTSHGRMHQIRKHIAQLGHPIIGDRKYGGESTWLRKGQLLHAWINGVLIDGQWIQFQSRVPDDFPFRVDESQATVLKSIWVEPLTTEEQLEYYKLYKQPRVPGTKRREGEAYPDFLARRNEAARLRDAQHNSLPTL